MVADSPRAPPPGVAATLSPDWAGRLRGLSRRAGLGEVVLALCLKIAGSGLAFAMLALAARAMGLAEFGAFATWFGLLSFAAAALLLGQEAAVMVDWGRAVAADGGRAGRAVLRRSGGLVLAAAGLGGAAILAGAGLSGAGWAFSAWAGTFAGLLAVLVFATHAARIVAGIAQGDGHYDLTWRLVPTAGAAFALLAGAPFHAETFFAYACGGIALALTLQGIAIARALRAVPAAEREEGPGERRETGRAAGVAEPVRAWAARSARLWLGGVLDAANQYVEICLIGLLLNAGDAGLYYAAARVAAVFAVVAAGLHVYTSREVARYAADPTGPGMRAALRLVAGVTAAAVAIGVVAVVAAGPALLSLFGPAFGPAYGPLAVLTVGIAAMALAGPAPAVLRLTGHAGAYVRITGAFALLRGIGVAAAALGAGLAGAVVASALCSVACALVLRRACRAAVGIDPSVLILVGRGRGTP